jgi:carbon storage regulator
VLVIRRRAGESLLIGDDVEVEVLDVGSSQVKLGIRAPKEITVLRKEIHLTRQQNRVASGEVSVAAMNRLLDTLR